MSETALPDPYASLDLPTPGPEPETGTPVATHLAPRHREPDFEAEAAAAQDALAAFDDTGDLPVVSPVTPVSIDPASEVVPASAAARAVARPTVTVQAPSQSDAPAVDSAPYDYAAPLPGGGQSDGEVSPDGAWVWTQGSWKPNRISSSLVVDPAAASTVSSESPVSGGASRHLPVLPHLPGLRGRKAAVPAGSTETRPDVQVSVVSGGREVDEKGKKMKPAATKANRAAASGPFARHAAALTAARGPVLVLLALVTLLGVLVGYGASVAADPHGDQIDSLSASLADQQALAASLQQSAGQAEIEASGISNDLQEAIARADLAEAKVEEEKELRKLANSDLKRTTTDLDKAREALKLAEKSVTQAQADLASATLRLNYCTDAVAGLLESVDWLSKAVEAALSGDEKLTASYVGRAGEGSASTAVASCENTSLGLPTTNSTDSMSTDGMPGDDESVGDLG